MTTLLPTFGYLACVAAVVPAVGLALFFLLVDRVASAAGWPGIGHIAFKLLEFVGTPWKVVVLLVLALALLAAGCVPASRGWGCLTLGLVGAVCLIQIVTITRPTAAAEFVILVPSAIATAISFYWAWQLLVPKHAA